MNRRSVAAAVAFVLAVAAGTLLDRRVRIPSRPPGILVADLHVHPFPGDGALTLRQLQREAARRGIDVIAMSGHNNQLGVRAGRMLGADPEGAIMLPSQELTAPGFHMIAVGVRELIDWRLSAREAIDAIHAQGGAAIAAHPTDDFWSAYSADALVRLDGAEVAHPLTLVAGDAREQLDAFFARARALNPRLSPIGSTDFHVTAPLGQCRTYLLVDERSPAGAVEAIRHGRTVAEDADGRLFGPPEYVQRVERYRAAAPRPGVSASERVAAVCALLALMTGILPAGRGR